MAVPPRQIDPQATQTQARPAGSGEDDNPAEQTRTQSAAEQTQSIPPLSGPPKPAPLQETQLLQREQPLGDGSTAATLAGDGMSRPSAK